LRLMQMQRDGNFVRLAVGGERMEGWAPELRRGSSSVLAFGDAWRCSLPLESGLIRRAAYH